MAVARTAGTFLGGFFNNPGLVAIALGIGALLVFRKPITEAFANFKLPSLDLPDINLGDVNFGGFKFPDITLPSFDFDFGDPFKGIQDSLDKIITQFSNPLDPGREMGTTQEMVDTGVIDVIPDVTGGLGDRGTRGSDPIIDPVEPPLVQLFRPEDFSTERTGVSFGRDVIVPIGDEFNIGGGPSFIGGTTTFGDNLVDTLSEVLRAFPSLRASQAANLLADNPGLTQSQFQFINPFGSTSLSSEGGDPEQILLPASGGFTGLLPEQIAKLLTGGNISNF